MKRLLEDDATELERILLRSIELDVPPEGAAPELIDRLEDAPVIPIGEGKKVRTATTWLFLVAALVGAAFLVFDRTRHRDHVPIVHERADAPPERVVPVSSERPAAETPLPPASVPAPSVVKAIAKPAPAPSAAKRTSPSPALSTLLHEASRDAGAGVGQEFDRSTAANVLSHVVLDDCRDSSGPSGAGHVAVTFANDGHAQHVTVDPPFAGTARGACVAGKFAAVRVPPFEGAVVRVGKSFVLQ